MTRTCEACGVEFAKPHKRTWKEFERRRFCSRACSMKAVRQAGQERSTHCRKGLHEMTGDNVRTDNGRRACKACAYEAERKRREKKLGRPMERRGQQASLASKPCAHPVQPEPPASERPVWRPAGWSPQPDVGRRVS